MIARKLQRLAATCAIVAAASASCGARSQLEVPDAGSKLVAPKPVACTDGASDLQRADPTLMFVVDRSGSMHDKLEGTVGTSRWDALAAGLAATLPAVDATMAIGALLFPAQDSTPGMFACIAPGAPDLAPAKGNVTSLLELIASSSPGGATPTAAALDVAAGALDAVRAASTARALVLATDGGPNCNEALDASSCTCVVHQCDASWMCLDDARTIDRIARWEAFGIPTYVVGIAGTGDATFDAVLNAMADAGGRAKPGAERYYAASSQAEMTEAFATIRDQVKCTFLASSVPDDGGSITLTVDGATLPLDATGAVGWRWGNATNGEVVLSAAACASVEAKMQTLVEHVTCSAGKKK